MSYSAAQLDQIVKLVVERLRQAQAVKPASPQAPRHLATIHEVTGGVVDTSTLMLGEKVISTESLVGRLDGISRVMVAAGSVVTPAARDELRHRKILLQFGGQPVRNAASALVVGSDVAAIASSEVVGATPAHCLPYEANWKPLLGSIAREISEKPKLGVLITEQAVVALCAANRNEHLRAMQGSSVDMVLEGKRQLGANLLVIHPRGLGMHGVRQLVAAFARDGFLNPPRGMEL